MLGGKIPEKVILNYCVRKGMASQNLNIGRAYCLKKFKRCMPDRPPHPTHCHQISKRSIRYDKEFLRRQGKEKKGAVA